MKNGKSLYLVKHEGERVYILASNMESAKYLWRLGHGGETPEAVYLESAAKYMIIERPGGGLRKAAMLAFTPISVFAWGIGVCIGCIFYLPKSMKNGVVAAFEGFCSGERKWEIRNGYQPTETGKCTGDNPPVGGSSTAQHN